MLNCENDVSSMLPDSVHTEVKIEDDHNLVLKGKAVARANFEGVSRAGQIFSRASGAEQSTRQATSANVGSSGLLS